MDGARVEKILDMASITLNKNSVPGEFVLLLSVFFFPFEKSILREALLLFYKTEMKSISRTCRTQLLKKCLIVVIAKSSIAIFICLIPLE